jgi:hypothetical protein
MLPHPDLKTDGKWARKLVELQCTAAVESNLVQRARHVHEIHGCALLKCEDGISRRVMLRRIDDKFENLEDEEELKSDRNVIELSGPEFSRHQSDQKELIKLANVIEKRVELESEYTGKYKEMLTFSVRGTYRRDSSNSVTCKYDMKLKNKLSMLLAIQILKELVSGSVIFSSMIANFFSDCKRQRTRITFVGSPSAVLPLPPGRNRYGADPDRPECARTA